MSNEDDPHGDAEHRAAEAAKIKAYVDAVMERAAKAKAAKAAEAARIAEAEQAEAWANAEAWYIRCTAADAVFRTVVDAAAEAARRAAEAEAQAAALDDMDSQTTREADDLIAAAADAGTYLSDASAYAEDVLGYGLGWDAYDFESGLDEEQWAAVADGMTAFAAGQVAEDGAATPSVAVLAALLGDASVSVSHLERGAAEAEAASCAAAEEAETARADANAAAEVARHADAAVCHADAYRAAVADAYRAARTAAAEVERRATDAERRRALVATWRSHAEDFRSHAEGVRRAEAERRAAEP